MFKASIGVPSVLSVCVFHYLSRLSSTSIHAWVPFEHYIHRLPRRQAHSLNLKNLLDDLGGAKLRAVRHARQSHGKSLISSPSTRRGSSTTRPLS